MGGSARTIVALLVLLGGSAALAATVVEPAFEDATLTGDLEAKILAGGPMIAYTTPREVGIWMSTASEARVRIAYYDEDAVEKVRVTAEIQTAREDAFSVLFRCDRVEPGRRYLYKLYINGKTYKLPYARSFSTPALAGDRAGEQRWALLGAHAVDDAVYPPHRPVQGYEAIEHLQALDPTAMLWVGNSTLVREADRSSKSGYDLRYAAARNWEGLRPLQATVPQYAAPGADDLGASAVNGWRPLPATARATFARFWPVAGRASQQDLYYHIAQGGVAAFVLDAFSNRNGEQRYGPAQLDWLLQGLEANKTQPLRVVALGEPLSTETYRTESRALIKQLRAQARNGPILLTAPGSSDTALIEHAPGLTQLVLGPFSRKPTPPLPVITGQRVINSGRGYGMLRQSPGEPPVLQLYTATGDKLITYPFQ